MPRMPIRTASAALLALVAIGATAAAAQEPTTATAYVNPDTGKPTANSDASDGSSCENPDQQDTQAVTSSSTEANGNVHVDACLKDAGGAAVDTQVSFESSGVGGVFKCPDPDKEGAKTAAKTDTRCTLSGYEAANKEYHVRLTSTEAGEQTVTFCADPQGDGCADAAVKSAVTINWAPRGGAATGIAAAADPTTPGSPAVLLALGLAAVVALGTGRTLQTARAKA